MEQSNELMCPPLRHHGTQEDDGEAGSGQDTP